MLDGLIVGQFDCWMVWLLDGKNDSSISNASEASYQ